MDTKSTDWRAGPNVCRCCLSEGCYKDISTEYFWMGKREVYAEMLSDTLNLTIAYSQSGGPNSHSRLICELCISRLRDASDFRRQVVECEKTFIQHLDSTGSSELEVTVEPIETSVKLEEVKQEKRVSDDDFDDRVDFDDDDDDLDDQPLTTLASKMPKKVSDNLLQLLDTTKPAEKRKSTTKTKASAAKKSKTVKKETVKATASKVAAKEKKKKDAMPALNVARRNAEAIILNATVYPFRLPDFSVDCVYCRETFADPALYRPHMKREHTTFKVKTAFAHCTYQSYLKTDCSEIFCRLCPNSEQFDKIETVAKHLSEAHNVKIDFEHQLGLHPFKFLHNKLLCGICDENFPCMRQLSRHMSSHYQNFTCDSCGKSYTTYDSLKQHIRTSHVTNDKVCRKCKQAFTSLEAKREHLIKSQNCWLYQCSVCQKRLLSWALKEEHLVQVHGHPKKSYPCPECAQTFPTRYLYRAHFNTNHGVGFVCSYCGRKFGYRRSLNQHLVIHTGAKMFPCEVCTKSFSTKKSLTQHSWIHSKYKRFECKTCNKQFNQRVSYKSHMRGHHPEISEKDWML